MTHVERRALNACIRTNVNCSIYQIVETQLYGDEITKEELVAASDMIHLLPGSIPTKDVAEAVVSPHKFCPST